MKATKLRHRAIYRRDFTQDGYVDYCLAQQATHIAEMARVFGITNPEFHQYLKRKIRSHAKSSANQSNKVFP